MPLSHGRDGDCLARGLVPKGTVFLKPQAAPAKSPVELPPSLRLLEMLVCFSHPNPHEG